MRAASMRFRVTREPENRCGNHRILRGDFSAPLNMTGATTEMRRGFAFAMRFDRFVRTTQALEMMDSTTTRAAASTLQGSRYSLRIGARDIPSSSMRSFQKQTTRTRSSSPSSSSREIIPAARESASSTVQTTQIRFGSASPSSATRIDREWRSSSVANRVNALMATYPPLSRTTTWPVSIGSVPPKGSAGLRSSPRSHRRFA